FTREAFVEGHALLVKAGRVLDIVKGGKLPPEAEKVSCAGKILAPGFIDAQVNGGGNVQFNNTPTVQACLAILKAHRRFGTTRILPTLISDTPEITQRAIAAAREARAQDRGILGIHIEGPHLALPARGAHKADYLRPPEDSDLNLYRRQGDEAMLLTVAPESVAPEQIAGLRAQGVVVSLGHTNATPGQIRAALDAGATGFTHLFNGMSFRRGADGIVGPAKAALEDKASWCGLIADGHHVSAEHIRLALRMKPGRIYLVSDAMAPAASDNPLPFALYDEKISVADGRCVNAEGKLAGSCITLADAVRYCIKEAGVEPGEALRMASLYPAMFFGLDQTLGKLLPGFEADVVVLGMSFEIPCHPSI
ncbi:MAG TPA: N-acetylglucosamine-6-phosphate deacetylase, partial [Alphaproteobacteria bacterium]|nr:N-acetylglucosamine-6-phosphate deacetylase [Alphaproteobacteria bacterium]